MTGSIVLVHSPLTGPSVWRPLVRELEGRGVTAVVPLLAGTPEKGWRAVVTAARSSLASDEPLLIVGHSNSGLLIPSIADGFPGARLLFVDARVPHSSGVTPMADEDFMSFLRGLAKDGRLPPWSRWWGEAAMRKLVPDNAARNDIEADMPEVPLSYLMGVVEAPPNWHQRRSAYLRFSETYLAEENVARAMGWPIAIVPGGHLQMVVDPVTTADALLRLASALRRS